MHNIFVVDAFTSLPFKGNPAAVYLVESTLSETTMQKIAFEMNLSETAFVKPLSPNTIFAEADEFNLRWFTPTIEVDLCGHATLATAHVLFSELGNKNNVLKFQTLSGVLKVSKEESTGLLSMNFPLDPPKPIQPISGLLESLGLRKEKVLNWGLSEKLAYVLVEVSSEQDLVNIKPDFVKLGNITKPKINGLIVTGKSSNKTFDFSSRFFDPWYGINEDPVTGSSHTVLAPYWQKKLNNKTIFKAMQLSSRTGELVLEIIDAERILIKGSAITTLRGTFSKHEK